MTFDVLLTINLPYHLSVLVVRSVAAKIDRENTKAMRASVWHIHGIYQSSRWRGTRGEERRDTRPHELNMHIGCDGRIQNREKQIKKSRKRGREIEKKWKETTWHRALCRLLGKKWNLLSNGEKVKRSQFALLLSTLIKHSLGHSSRSAFFTPFFPILVRRRCFIFFRRFHLAARISVPYCVNIAFIHRLIAQQWTDVYPFGSCATTRAHSV